jgi:hypothetical protein
MTLSASAGGAPVFPDIIWSSISWSYYRPAVPGVVIVCLCALAIDGGSASVCLVDCASRSIHLSGLIGDVRRFLCGISSWYGYLFYLI